MNLNIGIMLPFLALLIITTEGCQALTQISDFFSGTHNAIQREPSFSCPPIKTPHCLLLTKPSTSLSPEDTTAAIPHSMPSPSQKQAPSPQASPISIYSCSTLSKPA